MSKKQAKQWAPGELEASEVENVVSVDPARPHMAQPFGVGGYVVGTDGHRLHAVQCEHWGLFTRPNAPPAMNVIPWESTRLGEISVPGLEDARVFPARWEVRLEVAPDAQRCHVSASKGGGKKAATLRPFGTGGVPVSWFKLDQLTHTFGVNVPYLLDAVDFVGTGAVVVWGTAKDPLAPIVLTAPGVKGLRAAKRLAVVMPCRI